MTIITFLVIIEFFNGGFLLLVDVRLVSLLEVAHSSALSWSLCRSCSLLRIYSYVLFNFTETYFYFFSDSVIISGDAY